MSLIYVHTVEHLCCVRYAPRHDCGSEYTIFVRLLNQKKKVVAEFTPDTVYFPQWNDEQWHQVCATHEAQ